MDASGDERTRAESNGRGRSRTDEGGDEILLINVKKIDKLSDYSLA